MNKRGRNEGNIYRRSDGRWEARVQLGYEGGRRVRRSFYGKTRTEVSERLRQALNDAAAGYAPRDERQTVAAYLDRWLRDSVKSSVRPTTFRSYEMHVRVHIVPHLGRTPLAKLTPEHVQRLLNKHVDSGLSPRSVHHVRAVLRRALNQTLRWGLVTRNVATLVDGPSVPRYEVRAMSRDDARAFLGVIAGDRLESLLTVALATGMRQGELLGLRWTDIDLDAATVQVRNALQRVNGRLELVSPKTSRSKRTVALPTFAVVSLRAHRARQLEQRLLIGPDWVDADFVFTTAFGGPLDGVNVTHQFQRLIAKAAIPPMRFHDLRHACASLHLARGVHPRVVMEILGHSQISLTMNTYSHVIPALQRDAADQLDEALAERA